MLLPALYHWSPVDRRDSIRATGLQPGSPNTVATGPLAYVCLATSPARAWTISGAMDWVDDVATWDLWQVTLAAQDDVRIRNDFGTEIIEVKVHNVIPPDRCWWVAERAL